MAGDNDFIPKSVTFGFPVKNVVECVHWYQRVLGHGPEIEPEPGTVEFQLLPGCWLQLYSPESDGGVDWGIRLQVEEIESARARLVDLGIEVGPIQRFENIVAVCDFHDLDGNELSLVQVLG